MAVSASRLIQRAALFLMALAIVMVVSLFAGWSILTRFVPATPGIVLDTALCIFLAGAGLWLAQRKKITPVRLIAALLLPVGALNILVRNPKFALHSYVFPGVADRPSWPTWPQMAQGTGIALTLLAIALFLVGKAKPSLLALRLCAFLGTVVASLGLVTLLGYAAGLNAAPWWGKTFLFDMAIPTALACTVMGVALVGFFWQEAEGAPHQLAITSALLSIFCLLLLVAGADASLWTNTSVILTNRAAGRGISDELFATYALVDSVRRAETGQQRYLLTGDEQYLKGFSLGMREFAEISRQQSVHDAGLLAASQLEVDGLCQTVALEQQGRHAEAMRLAKTLAGPRLMEQIEQRAARVTGDLQHLWDRRKNINSRSVFSIRTTILWSYAMIILLACCALWLVAKEINRRASVEEDLRKSKALLGSTIDKLREQTAHAEEANRAKSSFLAAMSHEIRTPLTAVVGMADLLWESELSPVQRHYVEVFRRTGGDLITLINGLLDLSKIESGNVVLEATAFDIREVVEQVVETLTPKALSKGLCLEASIPFATRTHVVGDPGRLRQVLLNLAGNAIKFTAAGEVALRVTSPPSDNTFATLQFEVSDTGIGIAAAELPTIFDDFKQAESSTSRRFGGTGLGLGISRSLVRLMGGDIEARSELGKGSTFSFQVVLPLDVQPRIPASMHLQPLAGKRVSPVDQRATDREFTSELTRASHGVSAVAAPAPASSLEPRKSAPSKERLPILVAEDSEDNRFLLEAYCNLSHYDLTFAEDGRQAVAAYLSGTFALVIMDLQMPVMDGLTATREIRLIESNRGLPRTPILAFSADALPDDVARSREAGCDAHLIKPITKQAFLKALEQWQAQGFSRGIPVAVG